MEHNDIEKSASIKSTQFSEKPVPIPGWDEFDQSNQRPAPGQSTTPPSSRPPITTTLKNKFNAVFPPQKTYLFGLKRRNFLIIIAAIVLAVLALIIGLAAGLSNRKQGASNLPLPGGAKVYTGDLTYYADGLGACGEDSGPDDLIVSISHFVFDAASTSANPNANPLCNRMIRATRGGKSVDLKVVDRCTGCQPTDLDVDEYTFGLLADPALGRVDVSWAWL